MALTFAQALAGAPAPETAASFVEVWKRYRASQARYPAGHPKGGQWRPEHYPEGARDHVRYDSLGISLRPTKEQAYLVEGVNRVPRTRLSKQETGRIGEEAVIAFLRGRLGDKGAARLDRRVSNFPLDIISPKLGLLIEVKSGVLGVHRKAEQWRYTIGEPGEAEKAALARMSPERKSAHNARKMQGILLRKELTAAAISKSAGRRFRTVTFTTIIDPDRKVVDLFRFNGFHARIDWRSQKADAGYIASFRYQEKAR